MIPNLSTGMMEVNAVAGSVTLAVSTLVVAL